MTTSYSGARTVLLAFVILHAIVIFACPLLPFIDLPNHLAEATIFKYHNSADNVISDYYRPVPWYFPNTLHTVFCSLFPDVEFGNKIFHVLCMGMLAFSVSAVIKRIDGNPWYGLLVLLFAYNYNLTYGFVGFAISIPMLFLLFNLILRDIDEDRIATKVWIALTLMVLFLAHAQNALLGLVLYGVMMLYTYRKSLSKLFVRAVTVPLPLITLILFWWITRDKQNESSTLSYLMDYYRSTYFIEFPMRFRIAVFDNFQLYDGMKGIIIAAIFFVCLFVPLIWFDAWRKFSSPAFSNSSILAFVFFLTVFGCYMVLPDQLPGQTPLFQRFCTIVMLSFIVWASVLVRDADARGLRYFVLVVVTVYSFLWIEYLYSFNAQNREFNRSFFSGVDNRSRLAGLIYDHKYRGRKVYIHYPNYFVVWNKGIAASKIIDYRFGVIRRVADETVLPFYHELIGDGYKTITTYDGIDYLLVRGEAPSGSDANLEGFELENSASKWRLFKRRR